MAKEKFIQQAIKRPGSLRAIAKRAGALKNGKIDVEWARKKYEQLRKKAEGDKKLSKSELLLFRKLNLYLKVLRKVRPKGEKAKIAAKKAVATKRRKGILKYHPSRV